MTGEALITEVTGGWAGDQPPGCLSGNYSETQLKQQRNTNDQPSGRARIFRITTKPELSLTWGRILRSTQCRVPSVQQPVGRVVRYLPITALENCLELWILAPPHTRLHTISGAQGALPSHPGLPRGPRAPNRNPCRRLCQSISVYNQQNAFPERPHCHRLNTEPRRACGQVLSLPTGE